MIIDYFQTSLPQITHMLVSQKDQLEQVAGQMVNTIANEGIIYAFGTGHSHMIPMELFGRAGGLANVCAMLDETVLNGGGARRSGKMEKLSGLADIIWEKTPPGANDMIFIVSNSGRNSAIVEMALRAQQEKIFTVAITSLQQSTANTPLHVSGKKLYQLADVVLDNGAPDGDVQMRYGEYMTGPLSTLTGVILINSLLCESVKRCQARKIPVPLFQSQNTDRETSNEALFARFSPVNPYF